MLDACEYCGEQHDDNSRLFPLEGCPTPVVEIEYRVFDWSSGSWVIETKRKETEDA